MPFDYRNKAATAMKAAAANEPDTAFAAPVTGTIGELVGGTTTLHEIVSFALHGERLKTYPVPLAAPLT